MAARRHHKRLRALVVRAPLAPLRTMVYQQWIIHSVAALIFVAILAANILIWPIPRLGFLGLSPVPRTQ